VRRQKQAIEEIEMKITSCAPFRAVRAKAINQVRSGTWDKGEVGGERKKERGGE
jgi:hypothetical protein